MKAVLTYHSIDPSGSAVSVREDHFREHVRFLADGGIPVVPLTGLMDVPAGQDAIAITFDDGLESFGSIAAPLLLEAGLPATLFVVAGRVGSDSAWPGRAVGPAVPVFPLMDWDGLRAVADDGIVLGAHTLSHPHLTTLSPADALQEIRGSVDLIEDQTGRRPSTFAYPYGAFDDRLAEMAATLFDVSVTVDLGFVPEVGWDPHRIPRLDMVCFRDPGLLRSWGSARFRAYVWARRTVRHARNRLAGVGA